MRAVSWLVAVALLARIAAPATARADGEASTPEAPPEQTVKLERRFPGWLPWTLIGVGIAGTVVGGMLQFDAKNQMNNFDQRVASACAITGCELTNPQGPNETQLAADLNDQYDRAKQRNKIAVGMLSVSVAALVTGIILGILNEPRAVTVDARPTQGGATAAVGWTF